MEKTRTLLQELAELPEMLYHYTSMSGLLGIAHSREIWASHIRYLNDRTEQDHLWSLVRGRVEQKHRDSDDPETKTSLLAFLELIVQRSSEDAFVASFSANGDLLSQWLSYCPDGNGFAVGFKRVSMISNLEAQLKLTLDQIVATGPMHLAQPSLLPVFYLSNRNIDFLDAFLDLYTGKMQTPDIDEAIVDFPEPWKEYFTPSNIAYNQLIFLEATVKDASFEAERECRLILRGAPRKVLFRQGKSMITPYTTFGLDMCEGYFIDRVVIGPCPDPDLSERSVRMLFRTLDHPSVDVVTSRVPYRGW